MLLSLILAAVVSRPLMPLAEGTSFVYEGNVSWSEGETPNVHDVSRHMTWVATVIAVFQKGDRKAAVFHGFPDDLAWYEPGKKPSFTTVLQTRSGLFIEEGKTETAAMALARDAVAGEDLREQLVQFPMKEGDCANRLSETNIPMWCWELSRVATRKGAAVWEIMYRSNPDHSIYEFTEGIGITRYVYEHHGTVSSVDVRLVRRTKQRVKVR